MSKVYLGLGTNLGDKEANIETAVQYINELVGEVISQSAHYVTEPWGFDSTNTFINIVLCAETKLSPREVLNLTKQIERQMGRTHKSVNRQYKDRIIDIDILLYDDMILNEADLVIPHPLMTERLFVMQPLAEIAPQLIHPTLHLTIFQLLKSLQ
jgi:2-amino-4-hydroxy-6-hydroxymethyldihydropteridine diphosphokinase